MEKAKLKEFQIKCAKRLNEILDEESRAFLADEAGLGKTFTTTNLIKMRAEEKWEKQKNEGNEPTAYIVLYVGPNQSIIRKCCNDIVDKFNDIKEEDESICFMGCPPTKEDIKMANLKAFQELLRDRYVRNNNNTGWNEDDEKKYIEFYNNSCQREYENVDVNDECKSECIDDKEEYRKKLFNLGWKLIADYHKNNEGKAINKKDGEFKEISLSTIYEEYKKYVRNRMNPLLKTYDRLVFDYEYIRNDNNLEGKKILLFSVSQIILQEDHVITQNEKDVIENIISGAKGKITGKTDIVNSFIDRTNIVVLDEYHKYFSSISGGKFSYLWERDGRKTKYLFVSATPYSTNKSENYDMEKASSDILAEDEDKVEKLPSFDEFAKIFCSNSKEKDLENDNLIEKEKWYKEILSEYVVGQSDDKNTVLDAKNKLEGMLKKRMVRHERTMLSNNKIPEEHIIQSECDYTNADFNYKDILISTNKEIQALRGVYKDKDTAAKWSTTIPGVLSFSSKTKNGIFEDLKLENKKNINLPDFCFSYKQDANEEVIMRDFDLPKSTFAMAQICKENVCFDSKQHQLIWMPPTKCFYSVDENSIFYKNRDFSKLLVFGEYLYIQRGGAILLSDYVRKLCAGNKPPQECFKINSRKIVEGICGEDYTLENIEKKIDSFDKEARWKDEEKSLDEVLYAVKKEYSPKHSLFLLASPFSCLVRLNKIGKIGKPQKDGEAIKKLELDELFECADLFNDYFDRLSDVLSSWLSDNKKYCKDGSGDSDPELGILRYCAEGNLYSVMLEWCFTQNGSLRYYPENDTNGDSSSVNAILSRKQGVVHVQTKETFINGRDGIERECGFAERLTHDISDYNTSANDNKPIEQLNEAFNSPFYPMILFAGRGAQEGLDFHKYCRKIDHMTIPKGAASFDQRQGRIDRFRGLLVRERAFEQCENKRCCPDKETYWEDLFTKLESEWKNENQNWKNDQLFPDWQIKEPEDFKSKYHFERVVPYLKYTDEEAEYRVIEQQLNSYRSSLGASYIGLSEDDNDLIINLQA